MGTKLAAQLQVTYSDVTMPAVMPLELEFRAQDTALIVVDVQVDFCSPHGRSANSRHSVTEMLALPAKIDSYIRQLSQLGVFVVFTKAVVDEKTMPKNLKVFREHKGINPPTCVGSGGEELCELFLPQGSIVIEKTHFDPFAYTSLGHELKVRGIQNVLICGVRTEICVDATAKRSAVEGFHTVILSDLVATRDANLEDGKRSLEFFGNYYGFVLSTREVAPAALSSDDDGKSMRIRS